METIYTRHFEVIRVESKQHQAKGENSIQIISEPQGWRLLLHQMLPFLQLIMNFAIKKEKFPGKQTKRNQTPQAHPSSYLSVHQRKGKFYPPRCCTKSTIKHLLKASILLPAMTPSSLYWDKCITVLVAYCVRFKVQYEPVHYWIRSWALSSRYARTERSEENITEKGMWYPNTQN